MDMGICMCGSGKTVLLNKNKEGENSYENK